MKIEEIQALRPASDSSNDIGQSICAIEKALEKVGARLAQLQAVRGEQLLTAGAHEIRQTDDDMRTVAVSIEQMDAMLLRVKAMRASALKREKVEQIRSNIEENGYIAGCERFGASWRADYPKAAEAIRRLCVEEARLLERLPYHRRLVEELSSLGEVDLPESKTPIGCATDTPVQVNALGEMIRLPGVLGAPRIASRMDVKTVSRVVPTTKYSPTHGRNIPAGYTTHNEQVTSMVPVVYDEPFWWPVETRARLF